MREHSHFRWSVALTLAAFVLGAIVLSPGLAVAQGSNTGASGLPLPRFVTLAVTKANMRVGPKRTHPIIWEYQKKGMPLEVIQEHESWRRVRDIDGEVGWMHKQLLTGKRSAIINVDWASLRDRPDIAAIMLVRAQRGVLASVEECLPDWCLVTIEGQEGWVEKASIWGVYDGEVFD